MYPSRAPLRCSQWPLRSAVQKSLGVPQIGNSAVQSREVLLYCFCFIESPAEHAPGPHCRELRWRDSFLQGMHRYNPSQTPCHTTGGLATKSNSGSLQTFSNLEISKSIKRWVSGESHSPIWSNVSAQEVHLAKKTYSFAQIKSEDFEEANGGSVHVLAGPGLFRPWWVDGYHVCLERTVQHWPTPPESARGVQK